MRVLVTAGPTHEPIDPVRYLGNRSSGQMGLALVQSARRRGHSVTTILGPVGISVTAEVRRIDVQTSREMYSAVLAEFPKHDLLIMAAAVADFRPRQFSPQKIDRDGSLTLELEATEDILAAAGAIKRGDQRTVGFSLVAAENLNRSIEKLHRKKLDLIVSNPPETLSSGQIQATLLWADGRVEELPCRSKADFADILLERAAKLFPSKD